MNKQQNRSLRAGSLQVSVFIVLISIAAILIATPFHAAVDRARVGRAVELSPAERVAYQYAIEEVYWRHRIWPQENSRPKPTLNEVMSAAQIQEKIESYLRDSQLLAETGQAITLERLQSEMDRMASQTREPDLLRELFAALNNDPAAIAECLARPLLSDRLVKDLSAQESLEPPRVTIERDEQETPSEQTNGYTLPEIASPSACTNDSWTATTVSNAPSARSLHTAVWTGVEMIVWGGSFFDGFTTQPYNTGGRYYPATNSWIATNTTNAPTPRSLHIAVWTGSEMIVWGGDGSSNTGGKYNPATDSWIATNATGAPADRYSPTAVWTGNEMVVWGGRFSTYFNTGGRYNPVTDAWTPTTTTSAPAGRALHTAVWTGSEMIVWGGYTGSSFLNTGGKYNPATDSWTATSTTGAPFGRENHTAVWIGGTDNEMIVWGGLATNSGGRYEPDTDNWTATSTTNAPAGRQYRTAIWTGSQMIVWGGINSSGGYLATGGGYNPVTDLWAPTTTTGAPTARTRPTAVWTGNEMIAWGGSAVGYFNTGGEYCGEPVPTPTPAPTPTPTPFQTPTPCAGPSCTPTPGCGTFWNPDPISIPSIGSSGIAAPYPSNKSVLGLGGSITKVTVAIYGITHEKPAEIDVLLVGPTGQNAIIMSDVGGYNHVTGVHLLLDDAAVNSLPNNNINLISGIFRPTNIGECDGDAIDRFPSPAPSPAGGTPLSVFNGTNPNGTWSLYVVDDSSFGGAGNFFGGWSITIATDNCPGPTATPMATPTPGGTTHFAVNIPGVGMQGAPFDFTVTALDEFNNTVTTYPGTIHFTSSDSIGATLPPDSALTNGTGTFNAVAFDFVLSITATDTSNPSITGTSNCIHPSKITPVPFTPTPTPPPGTPSPTPTPGLARALNLSTRMLVGTGNDVGIGGFILTGTAPIQVFLRGIGPSLGSAGVTDSLADPMLELHGTNGFTTITNNNWRDTQEKEINATGVAPTNDLESAILATLDPGAYTAVLKGNNNSTGVGLVEIYDLNQTGESKLGNLSTRAFVGTGSDIVISGFILGGGSSDDTILLRGIGPSLGPIGFTNALANPTLELRNHDGAVVATNDDWQNGPPVSLPPSDPLESAVETALSPGAYTALLSGVDSGTGVGLVEVYDLGSPP